MTTIAVVIPCHRVRARVAAVIAGIGREVARIYCVDDACPDRSGDFIEALGDPRVRVLRHERNQGVGGAVLTGYRQAIADGADIIVKLDGDGQMDPSLLPRFVAPILKGECDYAKGNRFWDLSQIGEMPLVRRIGNLCLSFLSKASTGYWDVFDPTNGYTAIDARVAEHLPFDAISKRYFFESDLLFRLNTIRAVVTDVPMHARYGGEASGLNEARAAFEFLFKHARNFCKRIGYNYFLRDVSLASLELVAALALLGFAAAFGGAHWWHSIRHATTAPVGTIMVATVAAVSGLQFLLAFLGYDIASVPRRPLSPGLATRGYPAGTTDTPGTHDVGA